MGGITVGIRVDHLSVPQVYPTLPSGDHPKILLAPNLPHSSTVRSTLKSFLRENLQIPDDEQLLVAPLFTRLGDGVGVEEVYRRYCCRAEAEECDLFVDEEALGFFGRERGKCVDLADEWRLDEWNIVDRSVVEMKRAPRVLPVKGGRLFVETKHGILALRGISGATLVSALKEAIEKLTGVPRAHQLLSSVGRVMHDDFCVKDFDGVHAIYEDSIVDLTVSGDKNKDQAHRRMQVTISVAGHEDFTLVAQGRDGVQAVASFVEARTGVSQWQQRITLSGKPLDVKRTLADYMVSPDSVLHVTSFKSPMRISISSSVKSLDSAMSSRVSVEGETPAARKLKMIKTCKGFVTGTLIVPVLTSDTVGDLRRKVKRSLRPLEDKNSGFSTPGRTNKSRVSADCYRSPGSAYKLPPPPLEIATPPFKTPPQTPMTCYHTPATRGKNARRLFSDNSENVSGEKPLFARRLFDNETPGVDEKLSTTTTTTTSSKKGVGAWLKQILH